MVVIYKATRVFNFAVGGLVVLGGCIAMSFVDSALPWWLGLILALVVMGFAGWALHQGLLSRLNRRPVMVSMMATCVLIYFLEGAEVCSWMGKTMSFPYEFLPTGNLSLGVGGDIPLNLMWSFFIAVSLFGLLVFLFQRTNLGLGMRAAAEEPNIACSKGVGIGKMNGLAWVIGGITAALGGIFLGYRIGINPSLGVIGLKAFPVVLLGGLESFPGAIMGGVIIGVAETLAGGYIGPKWIDPTPFIILLLVLVIRPYGIFGQEEAKRV